MTSEKQDNPYRAYRLVVYALYWVAVIMVAGLTTYGVIRGVYYPETQTAVEGYHSADQPSPQSD